jgi:hypothetical protein
MAIFYGAAHCPHLSAMPTPRLILYQRDDCHLCDLALAELAAVRAPAFESVFIDDDALLEASYGTRVPVLRDAVDGRELDWPFDVPALVHFLRNAGDDPDAGV